MFRSAQHDIADTHSQLIQKHYHTSEAPLTVVTRRLFPCHPQDPFTCHPERSEGSFAFKIHFTESILSIIC